MILSRTTQYAIQALIYMARSSRCGGVESYHCREFGAPPTYLPRCYRTCAGATCYTLTAANKEASACGKMARNLLDADRHHYRRPGFTEDCVLGLKICSDKVPCPMHTKWFPIKQEIVRLLKDQTLDILAAAVMSGKYQLTDLPPPPLVS